MPTNDLTTLCGIYQIRHVESGKVYIGSATRFSERWRIHRRDLVKRKHHSPYLQRAWDKYGDHAFVWEVIEIVSDEADLIPAEQRWLDRIRPFDKAVGYNCSPTAGSQLGYKHTDEAKAKQSESKKRMYATDPEARIRLAALRKGTTLSQEHRQKISEGMIGRIVSEETRKRISDAQKGREVPVEKRARISQTLKGRASTPEQLDALARGRATTQAKITEREKDQLVLDFPE